MSRSIQNDQSDYQMEYHKKIQDLNEKMEEINILKTKYERILSNLE